MQLAMCSLPKTWAAQSPCCESKGETRVEHSRAAGEAAGVGTRNTLIISLVLCTHVPLWLPLDLRQRVLHGTYASTATCAYRARA